MSAERSNPHTQTTTPRGPETPEIEAVEQVIRERRFEIIGDTLSDHLPTFSTGRDSVSCKCDGTVWEVPDWWRHVGREAVAALDEDADHYREEARRG